VDGHGGCCGVKVLVLDGPGVAAVHGVGKISPKARDVKQVGTLADLLVRGKADAQLAVGQALFQHRLHSGHDLGHTSLVVSTQQGGAVGGDQGLALHRGQEGESRNLHHHAGGGQGHVAAVVVLVQDRVHVLTAGIRGGVHVGDEAQCGLVLAAGSGGQAAVDVAVLVHTGILHAQSLELLHQLVGQVKFPGGGRVRTGFGIRGGVHPDIIQKSFISAHKRHTPLSKSTAAKRHPPIIIPFFLLFYNRFGATGQKRTALTRALNKIHGEISVPLQKTCYNGAE